MENLSQFGFDIRLFAAQIVNFLVIVFIFKKFLYKPLIGILEKREKTIAQGLSDAQKAQEQLLQAQIEHDKLLKKAQEKSEKILSEAKQEAALISQEMLEKAKKDIERMTQQAHLELASEKEELMKQAQESTLYAAQSMLRATINNMFDKKSQDEIFEKSLKFLKHEKAKN